MRGPLRRWLAAPLVVCAALVLLLEEWLWDDLARLAAAVSRRLPVAWLEARIRRLTPGAALVVFAAPSLLVVPVKLVALWFVGRGHPVLGLATLAVAKVAGTAMLARLYALTEPQLSSIGWFRRLRARVLDFKDRVHGAIHATTAYRLARARALDLRAAAARWLRRGQTRAWRRGWSAARRLSRRRTRR